MIVCYFKCSLHNVAKGINMSVLGKTHVLVIQMYMYISVFYASNYYCVTHNSPSPATDPRVIVVRASFVMLL